MSALLKQMGFPNVCLVDTLRVHMLVMQFAGPGCLLYKSNYYAVPAFVFPSSHHQFQISIHLVHSTGSQSTTHQSCTEGSAPNGSQKVLLITTSHPDSQDHRHEHVQSRSNQESILFPNGVDLSDHYTNNGVVRNLHAVAARPHSWSCCKIFAGTGHKCT